MILHGDAAEKLAEIPEASVRCCVTSPPYWGLRDYGVEGQIGLESVPDCAGWATGAPCGTCYVCKLVAVFEGVRRVLTADGVLWLNLGDSYAGSWGAQSRGLGSDPRNPSRLKGSGLSKTQILSAPPKNPGRNPSSFRRDRAAAGGLSHKDGGLKPKDMVGIPWRVAFALQAAGWWLRQDIIWHKPNPMPESILDRCTKAHEYIFLLAKSQKYYYNAGAVAEAIATSQVGRVRDDTIGGKSHAERGQHSKGGQYKRVPAGREQGSRPATPGAKHRQSDIQAGGRRMLENLARNRSETGNHDAPFGERRNRRSVWTFPTMPTKEAHFATYPIELAETCILASSEPGDTVLDPFAGIGTTGLAAMKNGRNFVGIELNADYIQLLEERAARIMPLLS